MCAVSCVCAFDVSVEVVLGGVSWGGACYKVLRGIARCIPAISKKGGEACCSLRSAQRLSGDGRTRGPAEALAVRRAAQLNKTWRPAARALRSFFWWPRSLNSWWERRFA